MNGATADRDGLVISFARATPDTAEDAVDKLVTAADSLDRSRPGDTQAGEDPDVLWGEFA